VGLWSFLYSHAFVHGEDIVHTLRRRRMQAGVLAFFSHNIDPGLLAAVGLTTLQSAIDAHKAAGQMFGWEISTELQKLIEDLEDLHRRLNERRSQKGD
jgi:hypothetical protein